MFRQSTGSLEIRASGQGLYAITDQVRDWLAGQEVSTGLLTLFCRHTSASLLIQESAAPAARRDLEHYFERIAPESGPYAGPPSDRADADLAHHPGREWPDGARHVAGDLSVRAPAGATRP
jgi:secondary thiamine-phosphate synthase enzyme